MKLRVVFTVLIISLLLVASLLAACSKSTTTITTTTTATITPPAATTTITSTATVTQTTTVTQTAAASSEAAVEAIRQVITDYWDAFNSYDHERLLTYMTDSWREKSGEDYKSDIRQMKMFGVKLGVEEESPPRLLSPTEAEMMIKLKTPIGTKLDYFRLVKVGEEWKIDLSEER